MKKWLAAAAVLLLSFGLVSCSDRVESAKWDGYSGKSFAQYLRDGMEGVFDDADRMEFRCEAGWGNSEYLTRDDLSDGKKAYTFVADCYKEDIHNRFEFYVEYDSGKNEVEVKGIGKVFLEDGKETDRYEKDESGAYSTLRELRSYQ